MVLPAESLPDPLQALHSVLKAVEESIHILGGVVAAEGHADGRVDGKRADYVTGDNDKGGILEACKKFGWL